MNRECTICQELTDKHANKQAKPAMKSDHTKLLFMRVCGSDDGGGGEMISVSRDRGCDDVCLALLR
jgi:hypothetical protein